MEIIKARDFLIHPCEVKDVRNFVETHHYSHNLNGVKILQCFKAVYNAEIIGAIVYGQMSTTAWKRFGSSESEVLELRRLVFLDRSGRNSESRLVGQSLRAIKKCTPMLG